jgi:hypothetical protein
MARGPHLPPPQIRKHGNTAQYRWHHSHFFHRLQTRRRQNDASSLTYPIKHGTLMYIVYFKVSPASKISKACTNVPVECLICRDVHWKYNMQRHLQERHPSWEHNVTQGKDLNDFRDRILITNEEETKLGIPEDHQGRSTVAEDAYHARHMHNLPTTHDGRGDSPRRPRHTYSTNRSPLHFLLPPHHQRPSPAQISYNNDVFN